MNLRQRIRTLERRCEREARQQESGVLVPCGVWLMGENGQLVAGSGPILRLDCEARGGVLAVRPPLDRQAFVRAETGGLIAKEIAK